MKIRDRERILDIAKMVREEIIDLFGDTEGVCDNASSRMKSYLVQEGYDAKIQWGWYKNPDLGLCHCWVEVLGYIIDVCLDQFGGETEEIVFTSKKDRRYRRR